MSPSATVDEHYARADHACPDREECDFIRHNNPRETGPGLGEVCDCCGLVVQPNEEEMASIRATNDVVVRSENPTPEQRAEILRAAREAVRTDESLLAAKRFIDRMVSSFEDTSEEKRVFIPLDLWPELEWLAGGPLDDAVRANGGEWVRGEENGSAYVFSASGIGLAPLMQLVTELVNRDGERYDVTADEVPGEQIPSTEPGDWPTLQVEIGRHESEEGQAAAE